MTLKYKFLLIGFASYSLGLILTPDSTILTEKIGEVLLVSGAALLGFALLVAQESQKRLITAKRG